MKYKELIQFDPITTIVKLRDSAVTAKAQKLVSSYVISDTMKERLTDIVFKQIDWTNPNEHKGMLIVGNYGTGKSHLMSFISAIASDAGMVQHVQNADVKTAAAAIAGKFNVIREEIGAVTTRLRQIVVGRLQKHLPDIRAVIMPKSFLRYGCIEFNLTIQDLTYIVQIARARKIINILHSQKVIIRQILFFFVRFIDILFKQHFLVSLYQNNICMLICYPDPGPGRAFEHSDNHVQQAVRNKRGDLDFSTVQIIPQPFFGVFRHF